MTSGPSESLIHRRGAIEHHHSPSSFIEPCLYIYNANSNG